MNPYPPPAGSQTFSTKPANAPAGDFGPLPPPGTPQLPPGLTGGMPPAMQAFYAQMRQRPTITDQNIDQSVRNSAIGDGYSGRRNGFLWGGGQRIMPVTGSDAEDQATLRQFGVRPASFGAEYGFGAPATAPTIAPDPTRNAMNAAAGAPLAIPDTFGTTKPMPFGGGRNSVVEALMRRFGGRRF